MSLQLVYWPTHCLLIPRVLARKGWPEEQIFPRQQIFRDTKQEIISLRKIINLQGANKSRRKQMILYILLWSYILFKRTLGKDYFFLPTPLIYPLSVLQSFEEFSSGGSCYWCFIQLWPEGRLFFSSSDLSYKINFESCVLSLIIQSGLFGLSDGTYQSAGALRGNLLKLNPTKCAEYSAHKYHKSPVSAQQCVVGDWWKLTT